MDSRSTKATVSLAALDDPWGTTPYEPGSRSAEGGVLS